MVSYSDFLSGVLIVMLTAFSKFYQLFPWPLVLSLGKHFGVNVCYVPLAIPCPRNRLIEQNNYFPSSYKEETRSSNIDPEIVRVANIAHHQHDWNVLEMTVMASSNPNHLFTLTTNLNSDSILPNQSASLPLPETTVQVPSSTVIETQTITSDSTDSDQLEYVSRAAESALLNKQSRYLFTSARDIVVSLRLIITTQVYWA